MEGFAEGFEHGGKLGKLDEGVESCVPKKCRPVGNKPLWMNQNVLRQVCKKRRLWNWYKSTGDYDSMNSSGGGKSSEESEAQV